MMKRVPKPVFFIVALLILAFAFTAVFGVSYYNGDNKVTVIKGMSDIRWGIDISGGVNATFKPANDYDASKEELDAAKATIETRMISSGITVSRTMSCTPTVPTTRSSFASRGSRMRKTLTRARQSTRFPQPRS